MKKISLTAVMLFALCSVKAQDATTVKTQVKSTAATKQAEGTQKGKSAVSSKTATAAHSTTSPAPAPVDMPKANNAENKVVPAGSTGAPKK